MKEYEIGDIVSVKTVDGASSVGYLGSVRIVRDKKFDRQRNEWKYLTEPYNGFGLVWFYDHEL